MSFLVMEADKNSGKSASAPTNDLASLLPYSSSSDVRAFLQSKLQINRKVFWHWLLVEPSISHGREVGTVVELRRVSLLFYSYFNQS